MNGVRAERGAERGGAGRRVSGSSFVTARSEYNRLI